MSEIRSSLEAALRQMREPIHAETLSSHFEDPADAMRDENRQRADEICGEIVYVLRELPDGPIDMPLTTALRIRDRKRRKRSRKVG